MYLRFYKCDLLGKRGLFITFFAVISIQLTSQVNLGNLFLTNNPSQGTFTVTKYCIKDSFQLSINDTGQAGSFQYSWTFYATDSNLTKKQALLTKGFTSGAIDLADLDYALDTVKTYNQPLVLLELVGTDASSSDTTSLPLIIKSNPDIDTAYIYIDGRLVFAQSNQVSFSSNFPGNWVGIYTLDPRIEFDHGYYDYLLLSMTEYDSLGQKLRDVPFEIPFNDTISRTVYNNVFNGFAVSGRTLDPNDRFHLNTSREYYRFSYYYGVYGCGCDSAFTYFRVVSPSELDLSENALASFKIYPNPIKDKLHYSLLPDANDAYFLEIIDMQGKPVLKKALDSEKGFMYVNLQSGFYLYHLKDGDGKVQQVGKLMVE